MKLRIKLIIAVLAGSLFISVTAGMISFYYSKSSLEDLISQEHLNLARQTADKIDRILFERYLDIKTISGAGVLKDFLNGNASYEEGRVRFENLKENTGPWDSILLADKGGNIILSDDLNQLGKKLNPDDFPYNYLAMKEALNGKNYYSDVVKSKITGKPTIIFSSPVRYSHENDSEIVGVVVGQFDWEMILNTLAELDKMHAHIYNNRGLLIGSNLKEQNNQILEDDLLGYKAFQDSFMDESMAMVMPSNEGDFESLTAHLNFSGYREYEGNNWMLLLETPTKQAFASARNGAYIQASIISTFSVLFFLFIVLVINKMVIKPLNIFIGVTQEIVKGNLDYSVDIKGDDEIGNLAKSFNDMISELKLTRENVEKKVVERTADLEKINKFMVGREIKMIDLKKEINELTKNQCRKD